MVLENILLATFTVSAISLVGILTLSMNDKLLHRLLPLFVALAAGSMLAAAFFDLLPESLAASGADFSLPLVLAGIVLFFLIERFLHWHHHHKHHHASDKKECPVTWLNLIGDGLHNFIDGTVMAAAFMASPALGWATTLAIIAHEIPQEVGDFSLLVWGGFSKKKALALNFLIALAAMAGALLAFYLAPVVPGLISMLLPLAAGQFIYMACVDLVPELHKEKDLRRSLAQLAAFLAGIGLIMALGLFLPE